jgi:hypothetical protein
LRPDPFVIDVWAEEAIDDSSASAVSVWSWSGSTSLQKCFYRCAVNEADVQCGLLVAKLIEFAAQDRPKDDDPTTH